MQLSIASEVASAPDTHRDEDSPRDAARRKQLVEQSLWVVRALAVQLLSSSEFSIPIAREDLEGYGFCGLLEAADSFDDSRGTKFSTFAYYRIRGAMFDALRRGAGSYTASEWISLRELANAAPADDARCSFSSQSLELARLSLEFPDAARAQRASALTFISHELAEAATSALTENGEDELTALLDQPRVGKLLRAAIAALPDRERQVIEHLYFEPDSSLATGAERFGRDRSNVYRAQASALQKLRAALSPLLP
jgi:RNA polymerase sigma factor for flagellar operon FliA